MDLDTVLDELRTFRDNCAKRFGYDLRAMYRDLKEQERASGREYISPPPRPQVATADEIGDKSR